jgi:hypothetical protein
MSNPAPAQALVLRKVLRVLIGGENNFPERGLSIGILLFFVGGLQFQSGMISEAFRDHAIRDQNFMAPRWRFSNRQHFL